MTISHEKHELRAWGNVYGYIAKPKVCQRGTEVRPKKGILSRSCGNYSCGTLKQSKVSHLDLRRKHQCMTITPVVLGIQQLTFARTSWLD